MRKGRWISGWILSARLMFGKENTETSNFILLRQRETWCYLMCYFGFQCCLAAVFAKVNCTWCEWLCGHHSRRYRPREPRSKNVALCSNWISEIMIYGWIAGRLQWRRSLRCVSAAARLQGLWVRFRPGHWCQSLVSVVICQVEISATVRSLAQRSHTACGVGVWSKNFI